MKKGCLFLFLFYFLFCSGIKNQSGIFLYNVADMSLARQEYEKGNEYLKSLVGYLKKEADQFLEVEPYSVMQKRTIPPSNNKHDYYSLGVYWWPNPETKNGLPYIRHDGKKNPEYDNYDGVHLHKMSKAVFVLSLAYFYTLDESYAKKANELLYTWFINPETKMNPHLKFGQAIPGITEGRGIGIIETGNFVSVINAIGFLKGARSFPESNYKSLKKWFEEYNDWLINSQLGWDERMWHNNHGSSYDSQVAAFSLFVGEDSVATMILDSVKVKRISRQIEPDGNQPWETERTKSMSYSIKNLNHLIENAILAQHYQIDLWQYESEDGRSIEQAIKFLIPYMLGEKEWPYVQYGGIEQKMDAFKEMIWISNKYLDDALIKETYSKLFKEDQSPAIYKLLYPEISLN